MKRTGWPSLRASIALLAALGSFASQASAKEDTDLETEAPVAEQPGNEWVRGVDAGFDLMLLRPLGSASTVVGFAIFIPAAVMTLPEGKGGVLDAWELFVATPAYQTFRRDLGSF